MSNSNFFSTAIQNIKTAAKVRKYQVYFGAALLLLLIVVGAILFLNAPKPAAAVPDLTATLKEAQGKVAIKQPGQTDFSDATVGTILKLHAQLETGTASTARLDLPSGTIIRVAPSSLFSLDVNHESSDGLTTTLNLNLGQLFIILKGGSLDITLPSGVASVRGSYMSALIYPSSSEIFIECLEGQCAATNLAGNVPLTNSQKATLFFQGNELNQLPKVTGMSRADFMSWLAIAPESTNVVNQIYDNK